uniref:DUF3306 domain-containing protein n=1 Tax=Pararhizobium sp. IMCC3301 TaxID=3067904 RepID=UPI002740CA0A|nr:DUF3306 domain-containing protein [Pararhizobium sp. IMCC3301]
MTAEDKPDASKDAAGQEFLSRWSRLKAEAKEKPVESEALQAEGEGSATSADMAPQLTPQQLEDMTDDELLQHFDLPEPDSLQQGDDFSAFMKAAVPARLRNRALRKLWLSNPALANVDMLVDYGDDFTDAAMIVPGMTTAYQVGRGIVRKLEDLAEHDVLEAADTESDVAGAVPDSAPEQQQVSVDDAATGHAQQNIDPVPDDHVSVPVDASGANEPLHSDSEEPGDAAVAVQRMHFRFEA